MWRGCFFYPIPRPLPQQAREGERMGGDGDMVGGGLGGVVKVSLQIPLGSRDVGVAIGLAVDIIEPVNSSAKHFLRDVVE